MIEFDQLFCEDLKDDFEEIGRNGRNFELGDFIKNDLSRAFAFGYCYSDWVKEKMWFPVSVRKLLRHLGDDLKDYIPQLTWYNTKYKVVGQKFKIKDYAEFILTNIFCDDLDDLLKIAIFLGANLKVNISDE